MFKRIGVLAVTGAAAVAAVMVAAFVSQFFGCTPPRRYSMRWDGPAARTPMPVGQQYEFRIRYSGQWCPDLVVWRWGMGEAVTVSEKAAVGECASEVIEHHVFDHDLPRTVTVELYQGMAFVMKAECMWVRTGGQCARGEWTNGGVRD